MNQKRFVIADHVRSSCFIISEGVLPSGKGRGYVLRRLIRRSISAAIALGIDINSSQYFTELVDSVINVYKGVYDELLENRQTIINVFLSESAKYQKAITTGQKEWGKILAQGI